MNRLLKILFCLSIPGLVWLGFRIDAWYMRLVVGEPAVITNDIGVPYAVLTIDYGENPKDFIEGEFYVLKCLKVRGTKIDYGFCPIERQGFYNTRKEKEK